MKGQIQSIHLIFFEPDGKFCKRDGSFCKPDSSLCEPDGSLCEPDSRFCERNGSFYERDGKYEMEKQIEKAKQVIAKPSKSKKLKFTRTKGQEIELNEILIMKTTTVR